MRYSTSQIVVNYVNITKLIKIIFYIMAGENILTDLPKLLLHCSYVQENLTFVLASLWFDIEENSVVSLVILLVFSSLLIINAN